MDLSTLYKILVAKIRSKLNNPRLCIIQLIVDVAFDKCFDRKTGSSLMLYCLTNQLVLPYLSYHKDALVPSYRKFLLSLTADNFSKSKDLMSVSIDTKDCFFFHDSSVSCIRSLLYSSCRNI